MLLIAGQVKSLVWLDVCKYWFPRNSRTRRRRKVDPIGSPAVADQPALRLGAGFSLKSTLPIRGECQRPHRDFSQPTFATAAADTPSRRRNPTGQSRHLYREITNRRALGRPGNDFQSGSLRRQTIQQHVLAARPPTINNRLNLFPVMRATASSTFGITVPRGYVRSGWLPCGDREYQPTLPATPARCNLGADLPQHLPGTRSFRIIHINSVRPERPRSRMPATTHASSKTEPCDSHSSKTLLQATNIPFTFLRKQKVPPEKTPPRLGENSFFAHLRLRKGCLKHCSHQRPRSRALMNPQSSARKQEWPRSADAVSWHAGTINRVCRKCGQLTEVFREIVPTIVPVGRSPGAAFLSSPVN